MSTNSGRSWLSYLRVFGNLCVAYLAAFGIFRILGFSDDYIRPVIVVLAVGVAEWYLGRKERARRLT